MELSEAADAAIAQAVGVLMQRYTLNERAALGFLTDAATRSNQTLEEAAQGFVDEVNERGRR